MAALDAMAMLAPLAPGAHGLAAAGTEALGLGQILVYALTILVGGGAAWKVLPILLARLSVALAGAKSERDAIARLESQLDTERRTAAAAREDANAAYKERNDVVRELGDVKAQLAGLTERAATQVQTIERQNQLILELSAEVKARVREASNGAQP